eukprot:4417700-Prymnesium_polylepis.1
MPRTMEDLEGVVRGVRNINHAAIPTWVLHGGTDQRQVCGKRPRLSFFLAHAAQRHIVANLVVPRYKPAHPWGVQAHPGIEQ